MLKKLLILQLLPLTSLLAAELVVPAVARAAPALDQQQSSLDPSGAGLSVDTEQRLAQVVTSGVAGFLTEVRLPLECSGTATVTVEIREANLQPGETVLASSVLPNANFPSFGGVAGFRSIPFGTPPFIAADTQFAIVVSSSGSNASQTACRLIRGPVGDPYPRGDYYYDSRPNPPGQWVPGRFDGRSDLPFQTIVDEACRVPEVVGQIRADAEELIRRYGCAVGGITTSSSSRPVGTVVSQSPNAATRLASGSPVALVVSSGPGRRCVVPKLVGLTLQRARLAIARARCAVGRVTLIRSNRVARGKVVAQRPRPGMQLRAGARINLVVSRGSR